MIAFTIAARWDGHAVEAHEIARVAIDLSPHTIAFSIDAPFGGDPPPSSPPGRLERLWEHEVVEVFLVGPDDDYLEVEFGPHGHYLALRFSGRRQLVDDRIALAYRATLTNERWTGIAEIERACAPWPLERGNAFAIRGCRESRLYLAAFPLGGEVPDFHRIDAYPRLPPLACP